MEGFCYKTANIWSILGSVILVLKILIPIVVIALGIIDFGKATVSSDEKAIKKTLVMMLKKIVVGIVIFFVPTLINLIFSLIGNFEPLRGDYLNCVDCLTSPNDKCDTSYEGEIFH